MLIRSLRKQKGDKKQVESAADAELSLDNLGPGGILSVTGTDYLVEEKNRYKAGNSEWFEVKLSGDHSEEWWLNWEPGANEVTLTSEISFQDLELTPEQLEQFIADGSGETEYDGETYYLSEFGEADYFRGNATTGEEMAYGDFLDEDERRTLSVVQWASGAYDAYTGIVLPRRQVEVMRNEGEEDEDWT